MSQGEREGRVPKIRWLEERGIDTRTERIRFRVDARKRGNGTGWVDEGNSESSDIARLGLCGRRREKRIRGC